MCVLFSVGPPKRAGTLVNDIGSTFGWFADLLPISNNFNIRFILNQDKRKQDLDHGRTR
jgi:hypothetical protein